MKMPNTVTLGICRGLLAFSAFISYACRIGFQMGRWERQCMNNCGFHAAATHTPTVVWIKRRPAFPAAQNDEP